MWLFRGGMVALVASALVAAPAAGAAAASFGALAIPTGVDAATSSTRAIVSWDGETETIDVMIGLDAPAGTVGFVLPTPSTATLEAGDRRLFDAADREIAPERRREDDWWGRVSQPVEQAVTREVIPIDESDRATATTMRASNRSGLTGWLNEHDLHLRPEERTQIADYAADGWSISMIAVDASQAVDGELDPIRLSFRTRSPIFPMRLAVTDDTAAAMRFYVVSENRTEFRQAGSRTRNLNAAQSVVWAGEVASPVLAARGRYLTVTDVRFDEPNSQVRGDISIVESAADDPVIPGVVVFTPVSLLGFPLGWLLVIWGGVGVLVGCVYLVNRLRPQ